MSKQQPNPTKIVLVGAATAGTALYFVTPDGASAGVLWPCLIVFYSLFAVEIRRPIRIRPGLATYLKVEVLFLTLAYLLFYLPYQLHLLGAVDLARSKYFQFTYVAESNRAVVLATVAVLAFCAGIRIPPRRSKPRRPEDSEDPRAEPPYAAVGVITMAGLIGLYMAEGWRAAGEGRYTGTSAGGTLADGVSTLILMFSMLLAALWVRDVASPRPVRGWSWAGLGISLAWGTRLLLYSDRNSFFLIAIVVLGGLFTFRFRATRAMLAAALVGALLLYNAAEAVRAERTFSLSALATSVLKPQFTQLHQDTSLDITTVTVRASLATVPEDYRHGNGAYAALGVAGIVPFIRGALPALRPEFDTTAQLLGRVLLRPGATWGVGTNVVSDAYIDFGALGVPFVLYLFGSVVGRQRRRLMDHPFNPGSMVLYLLILALFAELPRYSIGFPVRIIAWAMAFMWVTDRIWRGLNKAAHHPSEMAAPEPRAETMRGVS